MASAAGKRWDATGYGCYGAVKGYSSTDAPRLANGARTILHNVLLLLAESAGLKG
jgi:hypothetical protein